MWIHYGLRDKSGGRHKYVIYTFQCISLLYSHIGFVSVKTFFYLSKSEHSRSCICCFCCFQERSGDIRFKKLPLFTTNHLWNICKGCTIVRHSMNTCSICSTFSLQPVWKHMLVKLNLVLHWTHQFPWGLSLPIKIKKTCMLFSTGFRTPPVVPQHSFIYSSMK